MTIPRIEVTIEDWSGVVFEYKFISLMEQTREQTTENLLIMKQVLHSNNQAINHMKSKDRIIRIT